MLVEIVRTRTRDDLRLEGAFQTGAVGVSPRAVDGFVIVHGTGGNFYSATMLENLANLLQQRGHAVVRCNTRGHDRMSTAATSRGGRLQGAAYEIVDECRHDLAAWVEWLRQRVGPRIGLIGHSLGAVKCIYAAAHDPSLASSIIAISPPRLSYSWFCDGADRATFLETYRRAEEKVNAGEPGALLEVPFPLPILITAAGYVEKYGPDERYNYLNFLRGLKVSILVTFGGIELANNSAFTQSPEAIAALSQANVLVRTIDGADHFYSGVNDRLLHEVMAWLDQCPIK